MLQVVRRRALWLLVVLFTSTVASVAIKAQERLLQQLVILVAFIPLLIDTGGDVGCQSSTVVIRGLSMGTIRPQQLLLAIGREAMAGLLLGFLLGGGAIAWAYWFQGDFFVSVVVGISLLLISALSAVLGAALPFLFVFGGFDPALMSAPLITALADVLGVLLYLWVAKLILPV